jgi:methylamine dehydrogenase heavy chain
VATQEKPWPVSASLPDAAGWRPGGLQMIAYSASTGMLYVGMHPNGHEGSHKDPAKEIWKIDLAKHKVMARGKSDGATCLQVSRDARPVLFAENGESGSLARYDGDTLMKLGETRAHLLEGGGPLSLQ